jgi:glutathione S-transferase
MSPCRVDAIKRYQSEIMAQSDQLSNPDANPRSTAQNEALLKLYSEKLQQMQPLVLTYGPSANTPATALHIQLTRSRYVKLARAIDQLENELIRGPYALGDQMSLADVHLMAWLARVMAVSEGKDGGKDLDALSAALQHECCKGSGATNRVGPKVSRGNLPSYL